MRWQTLLKVTAVVALIVAANFLAHGISSALHMEIRPSNEQLVHKTIMVAAVLYSVLLAIPFVPGVEIGLAIIGMFGPKIVFLVYLCTLAGLAISFAFGRLVSQRSLIAFLDELKLHRTCAVLREIEPLGIQDRLAYLVRHAPSSLAPVLLRHRHLTLAVALNLPGNFLIGGGGGIALIAGISRLYSVAGFIATIALATAPVPLVILALGPQVLAAQGLSAF
ncbi:MAG: hypothetical protein R3286_04820 [Gammaproteobacteria bacterium]|nr:hypothetical protein [Gammaproteobacteria bacterium]